MQKILTQCCSLCQISANDDTPIGELKEMLETLKTEAYSKDHYNTPNDIGQRAAFCITTPTEQKLVNNLRQIGFSSVMIFDRRKGYPEGKLKMWVKKW